MQRLHSGIADDEPLICAQRLAMLRASLARWARSRRKPSSRCARSTSLPPNPRSVSTTAMSAASSASPAAPASTTMRASRGGSGSSRSFWPTGVIRPCASTAPSSLRSAFASATAAAGGGSRKSSAAGSRTPQWARSRIKPERSAARISGRLAGSSEAVCGDHSRIPSLGYSTITLSASEIGPPSHDALNAGCVTRIPQQYPAAIPTTSRRDGRHFSAATEQNTFYAGDLIGGRKATATMVRLFTYQGE